MRSSVYGIMRGEVVRTAKRWQNGTANASAASARLTTGTSMTSFTAAVP
jgi:hypothetical protein